MNVQFTVLGVHRIRRERTITGTGSPESAYNFLMGLSFSGSTVEFAIIEAMLVFSVTMEEELKNTLIDWNVFAVRYQTQIG